MSDAAEKRLTPDAKDKLVGELRTKLSRGRLRRTPFVVVGVMLLAAAVVGIWYGLRPAEPFPRVMLIVYDALDGDRVVTAQLVAPGEPHAKLEGLDVEWSVRSKMAKRAKTKTDATGTAVLAIDPAMLEECFVPCGISASFLEPPPGDVRRDKSITVFSEALLGKPVLVVPLETFADWSERDLSKLPKPPSRSQLGVEKGAVIFASGDVGWETYERMRHWLKRYADDKEAGVPTGPLLHERADAVEARLSGRMGADNVRRWK